MARLLDRLRAALGAMGNGLGRALRFLVSRARAAWGFLGRRGTPGRWLALLPMTLLVVWLAWIGFESSGVRAGLEEVAREYVAFHRIRQFREELLFAGEESQVDPHLLAGILWTESSGRIDAVSSAGAMGLFQLKPITFEWRAQVMGLPIPTADEILSDPLLNARIGANNLAWLLDTYDGNVERALVAYNAGPGRLAELEAKAGGWTQLKAQLRASGSSQLLAYVDKVLQTAESVRAEGVLGEKPRVQRPALKPELATSPPR